MTTKGKRCRANNWTLEEDIALVEAFKKHGKKWSEVKIMMETSHKISGRSEDEIQNRWSNIWKKSGPYWDLYQRRQYKRPSRLTNEDAIQLNQEKFVEEENTREKGHNRIRELLLAAKNRDQAGRISTDAPQSLDQVKEDLIKQGQERKKQRGNQWEDLKILLESETKMKQQAMENLIWARQQWEKMTGETKEMMNEIRDFIRLKKAKLQ